MDWFFAVADQVDCWLSGGESQKTQEEEGEKYHVDFTTITASAHIQRLQVVEFAKQEDWEISKALYGFQHTRHRGERTTSLLFRSLCRVKSGH